MKSKISDISTTEKTRWKRSRRGNVKNKGVVSHLETQELNSIESPKAMSSVQHSQVNMIYDITSSVNLSVNSNIEYLGAQSNDLENICTSYQCFAYNKILRVENRKNSIEEISDLKDFQFQIIIPHIGKLNIDILELREKTDIQSKELNSYVNNSCFSALNENETLKLNRLGTSNSKIRITNDHEHNNISCQYKINSNDLSDKFNPKQIVLSCKDNSPGQNRPTSINMKCDQDLLPSSKASVANNLLVDILIKNRSVQTNLDLYLNKDHSDVCLPMDVNQINNLDNNVQNTLFNDEHESLNFTEVKKINKADSYLEKVKLTRDNLNKHNVNIVEQFATDSSTRLNEIFKDVKIEMPEPMIEIKFNQSNFTQPDSCLSYSELAKSTSKHMHTNKSLNSAKPNSQTKILPANLSPASRESIATDIKGLQKDSKSNTPVDKVIKPNFDTQSVSKSNELTPKIGPVRVPTKFKHINDFNL